MPWGAAKRNSIHRTKWIITGICYGPIFLASDFMQFFKTCSMSFVVNPNTGVMRFYFMC